MAKKRYLIGVWLQKHVAENFTIDKMIDRLENYFFEQINASDRK